MADEPERSLTDEQIRNERARRTRDQRRVNRTLESMAQEALRRQDNWIIREAIRQGVWEK